VGAGGVDCYCTLSAERITRSTDCSAGTDHIVDDCDDFTIDIEIFWCVFNGTGIDSSLFEIAEFTTHQICYLGGAINCAFVWTEDEIGFDFGRQSLSDL
tara:strand:+ start:301 stop:597 length:297 start_codon:yes stop_codon:yes gene_type:complete